jgi:hypothetical protein
MHSPATRQVPFQCLALAAAATLLLCHCFLAFQVQVHAEELTMSESVSFTQFVCCACYESGASRVATTFFGTRRAAELHISRSRGCRAACKGVMSLPTVYRPSKRAEDQEAGPVGAPGPWPVRLEGAGGAAGAVSYPTS